MRQYQFLSIWLGALAFILMAWAIVRLVVEPSYLALERREMLSTVERAQGLLRQTLETLKSTAQNYAWWDDAYHFVQQPDRDFITDNFTPSALLNIHVKVGAHSISIGVSVGIACYPEHGHDLAELLKSADTAMYTAKNSGAGFAFFDPSATPITAGASSWRVPCTLWCTTTTSAPATNQCSTCAGTAWRGTRRWCAGYGESRRSRRGCSSPLPKRAA